MTDHGLGQHIRPGIEKIRQRLRAEHPNFDLAVEILDLRDSLGDVLALARVKFGNLDPDANTVFERAEALLAKPQTDAAAAEPKMPSDARYSVDIEDDGTIKMKFSNKADAMAWVFQLNAIVQGFKNKTR